MTATLTGLHRYPLKSGRGEALGAGVVEPWGLAGDRRWMVVDAGGTAVTAREANRLVLVHPEITPTGLRLSAAAVEPLDVATPTSGRLDGVELFGHPLSAVRAAPEAGAWLSEVLGRPVELVWCDDPTRRTPDQGFAAPDDTVSFADGYPLLLATEESLAALNDAILDSGSTGGAADPLPMTRFRPNLVVSGHPAWAEDDWRRIRIGQMTFRAVKGCARCVLTTVDPDTAERGKEPIATLARIRRWDNATWFGVNLVPDARQPPGATVTLGDPVEVLDAVGPGAGPLRSAEG